MLPGSPDALEEADVRAISLNAVADEKGRIKRPFEKKAFRLSHSAFAGRQA